MYEGRQKINWLKRSYNDIFDKWDPSTATLMEEVKRSYNDIFDKWDPSTATLMEEVSGLQKKLY